MSDPPWACLLFYQIKISEGEFVKGTQLLIIRKIGKQFAVGLFFKDVHGISSLEI